MTKNIDYVIVMKNLMSSLERLKQRKEYNSNCYTIPLLNTIATFLIMNKGTLIENNESLYNTYKGELLKTIKEVANKQDRKDDKIISFLNEIIKELSSQTILVQI